MLQEFGSTLLEEHVSSPRAAAAELDQIFRQLLISPRDLVIAYVGATDGFAHLYEDDRLAQFLADLDARVRDLVTRHEEQRGRGLRVVLFSDHGCGRDGVHYTGSFKPLLRTAGLRVADRLETAQDVVAPTFGIVNYGALFVKDVTRAEAAARVMATHRAVDLAAFSPGPGLVEVLGRSGQAQVRWHGPAGQVRYACEDLAGDPLGLCEARHRLAATGRLDQDGFAHEDDWLAETAGERYPDPLRRLALAFTSSLVGSPAGVLLSLGQTRVAEAEPCHLADAAVSPRRSNQNRNEQAGTTAAHAAAPAPAGSRGRDTKGGCRHEQHIGAGIQL